MRTKLGMTLLAVLTMPSALIACGGDDGTNGDDDHLAEIGFKKPDAILKANSDDGGTWMEIGDADLTCLNTASTDMATTTDVTLATTVTDFQSGDPVPNAKVTVFAGDDSGNPFGAEVMADSQGAITLTIPSGQTRWGVKMTAANKMDTLLLNQITESPSEPNQTKGEIQIVSLATATALPAFIGETRTPGTGVLAGAVRDCQDREMSNYIATVSSTSGTATPLDGAATYYFSEGDPSLPVRHTSADKAGKTALFMAIQLPPTEQAFVQVWGYPTQADLDNDNLTLVSELPVPVIGDVVVTGSYVIKRTE